MRKTLCFSLSAFALLAIQAGSVALAQQAPSSQTAAGGAEIVLPVTVRDKKGELVNTLQKSDLTLTVDGHAQPIESLTRAANTPFRIGLLIDTSRSMEGALKAEGTAAGQFVDSMLPPKTESANRVFLIHFDREVELLEDFTAAPDKLHNELDDLGPTHPSRNTDEGPETTDNPNPPVRPGHNGTQLYDAIYLAANDLMKTQQGHKALIVFSDGADHGSKVTLNDAVDAADHSGLAIYTIFFKGESERERDPFSHPQRRGGIGFPGGGGGYPGGYPGSGGGRKSPEPTSATGIDGKKIMQEIATRTGGHAYQARKTADLSPIYKLIDQELRNQYQLTYKPAKSMDDGAFHKVAVTTEQKDWSVSTREGFYYPSANGSNDSEPR